MNIRPVILLLLLAAPGFCQSPQAERPRIDPSGIGGTLMLCGPDAVSDAAVDEFLEKAGGADGSIVVVGADKDDATTERLRLRAKAKKVPASFRKADEAGSLDKETGVWFTDAFQASLAGTPLEKACQAVLTRGGVLAFSPGAAPLAARGRGGMKKGKIGGDFLPDAVVLVRAADQTSPKKSFPEMVCYEIVTGTVLKVHQRSISVAGQGKVTIRLAPGAALAERTIVLEGKKMEDLTALRRAARARAEPPAKPGVPVVEKGTLIIVGGGAMPDGLFDRFVELAGGPKACIVVLPTAQPDPLPEKHRVVDVLKKRAAQGKVTVLNGRTRAQVESKEYLAVLCEATGIWFDGGRQWRFVDAYEGTLALPLMHDVLRRGGVIGGSSAGATIQGDYLCRGGVFNNFDIMYEGYERGLGFLPGVGIDQHFSQRKRFADMSAFVKAQPQLLGIGIDETTAIIVSGSVAEVVGRGKVHFYDAARPHPQDQPDYEALAVGQRYHLKDRKRLP